MNKVRGRSFVPFLIALALAVMSAPLEASPAPGVGSQPLLSFLSCPAPQPASLLDWIAQPVEGPIEVEPADPEPIDPHGICNCNQDSDCAGLRCRRGPATCLIALACDNGYIGSCRC